MNIKFTTIDELSLDANGDTDLLSRCMSLRDADVQVLELVRVDKLTAIRLDLFCQAYYESVVDFEYFLKVNNIINPFDVPIDKILIMPEMTNLKKTVTTNDLSAIQRRNEEARKNPALNMVTTSGVSTMTSKRKNNTTRNIGFKKLDNGTILF